MTIDLNNLQKDCLKLAEKHLTLADPGHDLSHSRRVCGNALHIHATEGGNLRVIVAAACLHDLMDKKFFDPTVMWPRIEQLLQSQNLSPMEMKLTKTVITTMSFSKQQKESKITYFTELNVVQDADRLDALGAIGIARAFSYGAHHCRPFYSSDSNNTIAHFHQKLFLLHDLMRTEAGRQMAQERTAFLKLYLSQFIAECPPDEQATIQALKLADA